MIFEPSASTTNCTKLLIAKKINLYFTQKKSVTKNLYAQ